MAIKLPRGNILLVSQVPDRQNANHKDRFVVLVRDYDDTDTLIYGVAITGSFTPPLPSTSVQLPYRKYGKSKTGLNKPSIADCTWIVVATPADIIKKHGFTPPIELVKILQAVQNYLPPPPAPPPAQPPTTTGS